MRPETTSIEASEVEATGRRRERSLYRDTDDKMIAGVCSGLGHYFDIHTTLVRVGFVVFTLLGGAGVLAYLVLWFALDPGPAPQTNHQRRPEHQPNLEPAPLESPDTDAPDAFDVRNDTATEQAETSHPNETEQRVEPS